MEKENGLQIVKQTNPAFLKILEISLQKGLPLLIEGTGEELDPILGKYCIKVLHLVTFFVVDLEILEKKLRIILFCFQMMYC